MTSSPPPVQSARLILTALSPDDATEMADVLADQHLYEFIGGEPPTAAQLRRRYAAQAVGVSPDGGEDWLNWIVRLKESRAAVGYVQATVERDTGTAELAWVIGVRWQRRGYATEAVTTMIEELRRRGVHRLIAHVTADHPASERVAAHVGLVATDRVVDGEIEWARIPAPPAPPS